MSLNNFCEPAVIGAGLQALEIRTGKMPVPLLRGLNVRFVISTGQRDAGGPRRAGITTIGGGGDLAIGDWGA
jgi:hypothetical protein